MKVYNLIAIPLAFVAGIVSIVLLHQSGVLQLGGQHSVGTELSDDTKQSVATSQRVQAYSIASGATTQVAGAQSNLQLGERIDDLQQQLRESTLTSDALHLRVEELEESLGVALQGSEFLPTGDTVGGQNTLPGGDANEPRGGNTGRGFGRGNADLQYDNLLAAGVDPFLADELKRQTDQWTLQRLDLIDQATREGWRDSDEFGDRLESLREQRPDLREELGEDNYDRYLFESGDFNRVEVSSIIDGSAAQLAGIQDGDVVLSYADSRVFSMRELQSSTREGARGESVQVQVLREGQVISVDLPRGPLGVTLSGSRVEP